jgi:hypothetical protein
MSLEKPLTSMIHEVMVKLNFGSGLDYEFERLERILGCSLRSHSDSLCRIKNGILVWKGDVTKANALQKSCKTEVIPVVGLRIWVFLGAGLEFLQSSIDRG